MAFSQCVCVAPSPLLKEMKLPKSTHPPWERNYRLYVSRKWLRSRGQGLCGNFGHRQLMYETKFLFLQTLDLFKSVNQYSLLIQYLEIYKCQHNSSSVYFLTKTTFFLAVRCAVGLYFFWPKRNLLTFVVVLVGVFN